MNRRTHRLLLVLSLAAGLGALTFGLGYRLPGVDRHPDWQEFPHLTNPHLVVEEIPQFDSLYGRRFPLLAKEWRRQISPTAIAPTCTRCARWAIK
jgi:hypothetical protein